MTQELMSQYLLNQEPSFAELASAAGLSGSLVSHWMQAKKPVNGDYQADAASHSLFWKRNGELLAALPEKTKRSEAEQKAAAALLAAGRASRDGFMAVHTQSIYDALTQNRTQFHRVEDLVYAAEELVPGLTPTREAVAAEAGLLQSQKDGVEIDQGLFVSRVLAHSACGEHLCHAMLLPRAESRDLAHDFAKSGVADFGSARLERKDRVVHLTWSNPRVLNAEDDTTMIGLERAVDVATLDPGSDIVVMRGDVTENAKYRGRRMFGAGINLTHLYQGKIPYLWFVIRDLGFVNKIMRGVAVPDRVPDDVNGYGIEKPWVAALDTFAIGGHCQLLLCMDYVLAASDAYMTLPARKEGIVPGMANLRLPRFVGDRISRQAIQYERRIDCDSPEGRMVCDEIVETIEMDEAIGRVVSGLTNAGSVGAIGNRRALRVGQEPLDLFRRYAAVYAREQAYCHFSPALIANLERNWDAKNRK